MGISLWRGKFNKSTGSLLLDKTNGSGSVEVTVELASIDFGHDKLNEWAASAEFFDAARFPTATYRGTLSGFGSESPRVTGTLSMRGVSRQLDLQVNVFKCIPHPLWQRDYCGADATGRFRRDDFGLDAGKAYGFDMDVVLRIQVEALAEKLIKSPD